MIRYFADDGTELNSFDELLNSAVAKSLTEHFERVLAPFAERIAASGGHIEVILRKDWSGATLEFGAIPEALEEEIRQALEQP